MRDLKMVAGIGALALLAGSAQAGIAQGGEGEAFILADSELDFSDTQGLGGWFYGYYDGDVADAYTPEDFELMNVFNEEQGWWMVSDEPDGFITLLGSNVVHPNGEHLGNTTLDTAVHHSVRRWVSDEAGPVNIHVETGRADTSELGDGVILTIFVDGKESLAVEISPNNPDPVVLDLFAEVAEGSVIDFAIEAKENDGFDGTSFRAIISSTVIPSPGGMALMGLGGLVAARRRR